MSVSENQLETASECERMASSPLSERRWKMEDGRWEEEREQIFQTHALTCWKARLLARAFGFPVPPSLHLSVVSSFRQPITPSLHPSSPALFRCNTTP